ncbi:MAG: hypothetical protein ACRERD_33845 [Candidatus Binatia bacterium]
MNQNDNLKSELFGAWSGVLFAVVYVILMAVVARMLPPPSPIFTPEQLAAYWAERPGITFGASAVAFFSFLLITWSAGLTIMLARIEGNAPFWTIVQAMGGALTGWVFISTPVRLVLAGFRGIDDPVALQSVVDSAWLDLTMTYVVTSVQYWAIGIVGLMDKRENPLFPQWLCYLTILSGAVWMTYSGIPWNRTGPLAWDGLVGLYVAFTAFLGTMVVLSIYMIKDVRKRMRNAEFSTVNLAHSA